MNERDKELANQVTWYADVTFTELSRFAAIIRADEREACLNCYSPDDTATDWADKIRARGNT